MEKAMSIAGMVIGGLLALTFALDLVAGFPFGGRAGLIVSLGFTVCGVILAYLGWSAYRESL